jgi:hypothetical protein
MSDERAQPTPPKGKPIVVNPSTPGIQTPNKPDGRDAPAPGITATKNWSAGQSV